MLGSMSPVMENIKKKMMAVKMEKLSADERVKKSEEDQRELNEKLKLVSIIVGII